jgi:hypothetical protein
MHLLYMKIQAVEFASQAREWASKYKKMITMNQNNGKKIV